MLKQIGYTPRFGAALVKLIDTETGKALDGPKIGVVYNYLEKAGYWLDNPDGDLNRYLYSPTEQQRIKALEAQQNGDLLVLSYRKILKQAASEKGVINLEVNVTPSFNQALDTIV